MDDNYIDEKKRLYNIQLADLELFLAVVECGNFTRAGEKVFMTQSWVSKRISRMERELGFRLFIRNNREIILTPAGMVMKQHLENITTNMHHAIQSALAAQTGATGSLRMCCLLWRNYSLIKLLGSLIDLNPQIIIDFEILPPSELYTCISTNKFDLIFALSYTNSKIPAHEYEIVELMELPLVVYLNSRHPLAGKETLEVKDLSGTPLLMMDDKTSPGYDGFVRRLFLENNADLVIARYVKNIDSHISNIIMNRGVFVSGQLFMEDVWEAAIKCIPIRGQKINAVAFWKKNNMNPALKTLIENASAIIL